MGGVKNGFRWGFPPARSGACSPKPSSCPSRSSLVVEYLAGADPLEVLTELRDSFDMIDALKIGAGSLGDVILAQERHSNAKFAVKVVSLRRAREVCSDEGRLRHEVRLMHELDHPNLVRLIDVMVCSEQLQQVDKEPPYLCIVMEYVADSEPLSNLIRRLGAQPSLAIQVALQLASALQLMHRQGIVHRDVWSENVLVSKQGHVVLVDLGCAEYYRNGHAVCSKLNVPYMSPEAADGSRQQPGDDCWALGLLVSEMVTGRFIADRMGNCSTPSHYVPEMLDEILQETLVLGGLLLGRLCASLLDMDAHCRASMMDVLTELGGGVACASPLRSQPEGPRLPPSGQVQSSSKSTTKDGRSALWSSKSVECLPGSRGMPRSQSTSFCSPSRQAEGLHCHSRAIRDRPQRPSSTTAARSAEGGPSRQLCQDPAEHKPHRATRPVAGPSRQQAWPDVMEPQLDTRVAFVAPPRAPVRRLEGIEALPGGTATAVAAASAAAAAAAAAATPLAVAMPTVLTPGVPGPLRSGSSTPSPGPLRHPQPSFACAYTTKYVLQARLPVYA